ncbi:MAG: 4Fe-4S binding protein [Promethearchaeota archaeon]|nr:MAG: 4Fe-4S binding protein [Candidatus Lokiarchaeota archaeon]
MEKLNINLKERKITIIRRIVQIISFLFINYIIIERLFLVNLMGFEGIIKIQPFLATPRNPLSEGAGIVEYIFYSFTQGIFPLFLIGLFILIILLSNRFFCGWICPIGTIQDALYLIPTNKKTMKYNTHKSFLKIKTFITIGLIIIMLGVFMSSFTDDELFEGIKASLGPLGTKPMAIFSLSEFIFVIFPDVILQIFLTATLFPIFSDIVVFISFFFYLIILGLTIFYPRVYCRYICPVGALSGMISRFSFLKLARSPVKCPGRQECGECENVCPKQIRILDESFDAFTGEGECNFCLKCLERCPHDAIQIKFG